MTYAAIPDGEVDELCSELGEASKRVVVPSGRVFCDTNSATWRASELITRQAARLTALEAEKASANKLRDYLMDDGAKLERKYNALKAENAALKAEVATLIDERDSLLRDMQAAEKAWDEARYE
jgi:hypothetical protein